MKNFCTIAIMAVGTAIGANAQIAGSAPISFNQPATTIDEAQLQSLLSAPRPQLVFAHDDVIQLRIYGFKDYLEEQTVALHADAAGWRKRHCPR